MQRNPEVHSRFQPFTAMRVIMAGAILFGAGCSAAPETEIPEEKITWEVEVPDASVLPDGGVIELNQCQGDENLAPIQQFDSSGFFKEDPQFYIRDMVEIMDLAQPTATPQEYANHFIGI